MKAHKQQQAANLYFHTSLTQQQIAGLLGVDRKTMRRWIADGQWARLKRSVGQLQPAVEEQLYLMLAHLSQQIISRPGQPSPDIHEVARFRNLAACLARLRRRHIAFECTEAFTHLADDIAITDPTLAARLRPHILAYLQQRADLAYIRSMPTDADRRNMVTDAVITTLYKNRSAHATTNPIPPRAHEMGS